MTTKGVYFMTDRTVELLDAATDAARAVAVLDERHRRDLCVSRDDPYLVWAQLDRNTTVLMLVEDLR